MKKYIIIKTQFEAIHAWPTCPLDDVAFLKHSHRHIFHVKVKMEVNHNDRDLEFITVKRLITEFVRDVWEGNDLGPMSCEDMCETIITEFPNYPIVSISVFEDNENGAEITNYPTQGQGQ